MPTSTTNYGFQKPLVNDPTDEDLWGGYLNDDLDDIDTEIKIVSDRATLPVGSIYINRTVATNPATLLGYGTWTAIQNVFLLANGGTYAAGSSGGVASNTIAAANLPELAGTVTGGSALGSGSGKNLASTGTGSGTLDVVVNAGSANTAISNLPPYITVYVWERTA